MSGGHWDYKNDWLCENIFGVYPDYGKAGFDQSKYARKRDPFEDIELSELIYDVFCLMHSADWYFSADTGEETYRKDVAYFKNKWLARTPKQRLEQEIESALDMARENLNTVFGANIDRDNMPIKVKYFDPDIDHIQKIAVGDWIDLRAAERVEMKRGEYYCIRLGVGMILPDGYEALLLPRSSTPEKFGIMCAHSMGVIDNSYSGDTDEWKFPAVALRDTVIEKGDRIAQFRIIENQPSITFETVDHLNAKSRGGLGSTGTR